MFLIGSITWLAFHKDRLLLSASEDGTICVWKCGGRWDCLATLTGHKWVVATQCECRTCNNTSVLMQSKIIIENTISQMGGHVNVHVYT